MQITTTKINHNRIRIRPSPKSTSIKTKSYKHYHKRNEIRTLRKKFRVHSKIPKRRRKITHHQIHSKASRFLKKNGFLEIVIKVCSKKDRIQEVKFAKIAINKKFYPQKVVFLHKEKIRLELEIQAESQVSASEFK